jgi:D-glycero-D-manno-heptose 1,7-bisphosphate phosphatase
MILEIAGEFGIDLARSFMVGDRKSDVDAGRAAGCATVFIDLDYAEAAPESPDYVVKSIVQAADVIIESTPTMQEAL